MNPHSLVRIIATYQASIVQNLKSPYKGHPWKVKTESKDQPWIPRLEEAKNGGGRVERREREEGRWREVGGLACEQVSKALFWLWKNLTKALKYFAVVNWFNLSTQDRLDLEYGRNTMKNLFWCRFDSLDLASKKLVLLWHCAFACSPPLHECLRFHSFTLHVVYDFDQQTFLRRRRRPEPKLSWSSAQLANNLQRNIIVEAADAAIEEI